MQHAAQEKPHALESHGHEDACPQASIGERRCRAVVGALAWEEDRLTF